MPKDDLSYLDDFFARESNLTKPGPQLVKSVPTPNKLRPQQIADLRMEPLVDQPFWIERGVIVKNGKTIIGAEAGAGKTHICMEFARSLCLGEPLFKHPELIVQGKPNVLYIEQELGREGLKERIHRLFTTSEGERVRERFFYLSRVEDPALDTPEGYDKLKEYVESCGVPIHVLILDPASDFLDGDDSDNTQVRKFLANLDKLIEAYADIGMSTLISHHYRKPQQTQNGKEEDLDFYRMRGASKWVDKHDTRIAMIKLAEGDPDWWLKMRFLTRRRSSMKPIYLHANEGDKGRVLWTPEDQLPEAVTVVPNKSSRRQRRPTDNQELKAIMADLKL